jgi:REP element-mobilizing transposase RayT
MATPRQLTFHDHRMRTGRGGPRKNAGRKAGRRPLVHHVRRERFRSTTPSLVTVRARAGLPSLRGPQVVAALRETFRISCVRKGFRLVHYSVQRDHVHMIVEADDNVALSRGMMSIVSRIAFAVNRVFRRRGKVMAGRSHVRCLTSPRQVHRALRYVLLNVRKHCFARTGRAGSARIDAASSGRWSSGWSSTSPRSPDAHREVAHPNTWLLSAGWKRHGTIALAEIPGTRA